MDTSDERWLPVVGYEGVYEVSDQGRVRRIAKSRGAVVGRILRASRAVRGGYLMVQLQGLAAGKARQLCPIHRLVLTAFSGPPPPGMECRHLNGDCTDNRPENLRWGTRKENIHDNIRNGTFSRGESQPGSKLTAEKVGRIKTMLGAATYEEIGREFGVSRALVSKIARGKSWPHVPAPETRSPNV